MTIGTVQWTAFQTPTGLELPEGLGFDEWAGMSDSLLSIGKSINWWLGDWLNYGERKYGETYAAAVEATGYDEPTLMTIKWVSGAVERSIRIEHLSWSHHRIVASMEPEEQSHWLRLAFERGWSTRELRTRMRAAGIKAETFEVEDREQSPLPKPGRWVVQDYDDEWHVEDSSTGEVVAATFGEHAENLAHMILALEGEVE